MIDSSLIYTNFLCLLFFVTYSILTNSAQQKKDYLYYTIPIPITILVKGIGKFS